MENKIKIAVDKLENIVNYHNKNLTKKQYYDLVEILETMKEIKNHESEEKKMKQTKYDFVVIYEDNKNIEEMKELIMQKIKDFNFEIKEVENWGSKLLAYPIKKQNKGYYVVYNLVDSEEDTEVKASNFTKEIDKLQYEENKILKYVLVRL